jgi:hypothetical protein
MMILTKQPMWHWIPKFEVRTKGDLPYRWIIFWQSTTDPSESAIDAGNTAADTHASIQR